LDALKATKRQRDSYKTVTLRVGQERAALIDWAGGCVAEAALVDGAFPDYTRVVPVGDPPKGRVTVLREQLIGAVTAVTAFAKASDDFVAMLWELVLDHSKWSDSDDDDDDDFDEDDEPFWCEVLVLLGLLKRASDGFLPTRLMHNLLLERCVRQFSANT
jgi:hypothetical protein